MQGDVGCGNNEGRLAGTHHLRFGSIDVLDLRISRRRFVFLRWSSTIGEKDENREYVYTGGLAQAIL